MSATLVKATDRAVVYVREVDDAQMETLQPGEHLATPQAVHYAESENDLLTQLATVSDAFPPLPASGWLEAGAVYQYGDVAVIVRQSHERTEHAPEDVPALFLVYRADATETLEWVAGEQVVVGTRRSYEGAEYECLQSHVTEFAPSLVPALWRAVINSAEPQPWVQPTGAHDAYALGDRVTYGGFTWESTIDANVWAPGVYGWVKV